MEGIGHERRLATPSLCLNLTTSSSASYRMLSTHPSACWVAYVGRVLSARPPLCRCGQASPGTCTVPADRPDRSQGPVAELLITTSERAEVSAVTAREPADRRRGKFLLAGPRPPPFQIHVRRCTRPAGCGAWPLRQPGEPGARAEVARADNLAWPAAHQGRRRLGARSDADFPQTPFPCGRTPGSLFHVREAPHRRSGRLMLPANRTHPPLCQA